MSLIKRPRLDIVFSPRVAPSGPSGVIKKAALTENPRVPRPVERVVGDTDLNATGGIVRLYDDDVQQRHITRLLSAGLFGVQKRRRMVPTTWSITAVDDILGKKLWKKILQKKWINEVLLFGHKALGNSVQILLYPSAWMFEAFEYWLIGGSGKPDTDWETWKGRKTYASKIVGAYYATRLPVLEYLIDINRQAGALVFMEVDKDWVPLGVWRFREIAREALKRNPLKFDSREEAFSKLKKRLVLPLENWLAVSETLNIIRKQKTLDEYFPRDIQG
jgi:hypothetical protein